MTITMGPNLGLAVNGGVGEEHYAQLMAQWRGLDGLIQCNVLDKDLTVPPGAPADGDCYIVPATAVGSWTGQSGKLVRWSAVANAWEFFTPKAGWRVYVVDEGVVYTFGTAWSIIETRALLLPNDQTGTTYTFVFADGYGRKLRFSNAATITATVPTNANVPFPVGVMIPMRQVAAGAVSLVGEATVTINVPTGSLATSRRQGSEMMIHKVATNTWDLIGDLANA